MRLGSSFEGSWGSLGRPCCVLKASLGHRWGVLKETWDKLGDHMALRGAKVGGNEAFLAESSETKPYLPQNGGTILLFSVATCRGKRDLKSSSFS